MLTLTATEFFTCPGRRNQEVQSEPIEVKSHGRPVGYYLSPAEYRRLSEAARRAFEPGAYNSIKPLIHARRNEILALAKKYGIERIRLFGSVARGEDKPQSDIDILIEFPAGHEPSFNDFGIGSEIERMFDGRHVDIVDLKRANKQLLPSILEDAVDI
jgi:predicted nucleotidyltransferase